MNVCECVLQKSLKKVNQAKLNFVPLEISMMIEIFLFNRLEQTVCALCGFVENCSGARVYDLIRSHILKFNSKKCERNAKWEKEEFMARNVRMLRAFRCLERSNQNTV